MSRVRSDPVQAIARFLAQSALKRLPRRLCVAVSGGADSVALLRASHAAALGSGWGVEALHCDHGLRGPASLKDAAFVRRLCARLNVPLREFSAALKAGPGLEERARAWRRDCYAQAARAGGARLVLLGHHARDQAETLLMNLARGSGLAGAAGMLALSPLGTGADLFLGRPFLGLDSAALKTWLRAQSQGWREDPSNRNPAFARNRVRLRILPELERVNPRAVAHLADFAASLAPQKKAVDLAGLLHLGRSSRARAAAALAKGRGQTDLGQGWTLDLSAGKARVLAPPDTLRLTVPGAWTWGEWRFELKLAVPTARSVRDGTVFWFSPSLLKAGAGLRTLKPGERLCPYGFKGRRRALDLLRDAGVPEWGRQSWPALVAEGRLLALPGVRRGTGFEARAGFKALRLSWLHPGVDKGACP